MPNNFLRELASLYGIHCDSQIEDVERIRSTERHLITILQAIGLPIAESSEAAGLLLQEHAQQWRKLVDPILVLEENEKSVTIPMRLPVADDRPYQWTIIEEGGNEHHGGFKPSGLAIDVSTRINGYDYGIYHLNVEIPLPYGYHQLKVWVVDQPNSNETFEQQLIITPRHCYVPAGIAGDNRVWGGSVYLHAIRSRTNWGIGDFTDLKQVLSWSADLGAGTVHCAPLNSIPFITAKPHNPYAPSSRAQLNVLFLDIETIPDFIENEEARSHSEKADFQARLVSLRSCSQIDYEAVYTIKEEFFKKLWKHFSENHLNPETNRGQDFRHFQQEGGETLYYYALFSALGDEVTEDGLQERDWGNWPVELRDPFSEAVVEFARGHESEIEYHQYLQWQAELQLASIGRRSMELGLKVGLLREFPFSPGGNGFEAWYYNGLLIPDMQVARDSLDDPCLDPALGLPIFLPNKLRDTCYRPVVEGLRQTMRYAGAVHIRSMANYFQTAFSMAGQSQKAFIRFSSSDLVGILTLESQRNRCLVIADTSMDQLPAEQQQELRQRKIFSSTVLFQARDDQGNWLEPADYPSNCMVAASPSFLASMRGFWQGRDIALKTEEKLFDDAAKEQAILSRASERAHYLISLDHADLLPDGYELDPALVNNFDAALSSAGQIFLARSQAKILLVAMGDLLGMEEQAEPPVFLNQPFWIVRYSENLEAIVASQEVETLCKALCRERGIGVVRPSAPASARKKQLDLRLPSSFYRLQLNKNFTFAQAASIIPYLKGLGISHCYISPMLVARPGSPHGYDIINHGAINPEIGSREDFEMFISVLEHHQMALLLDIVPNHMGIGSDNPWWMDVLENGELSPYAGFFDINWQPLQPGLVGRVLLPVLGDHYGKILEGGGLSLRFDENTGSISIHYYEHRFPVTPKSYPALLAHDLARLGDRLGHAHTGYLELQNLLSAFSNLPDRQDISDEKIQIHQRDKEINKRLLARLGREHRDIKQFIEENIILFNGECGRPESYDLLHGLLEKQPYRLAFWRVAADEINYRRFFDINDLAGLRMEEERVFAETHSLVLDLISTGKVDGLRIDHPDGLYNPLQYFSRLQAAVTGETQDIPITDKDLISRNGRGPLYVVVEKILADFEFLPETWPVHGTTGYDFANQLNGLLLDTEAEKAMTSLYYQFIGKRFDFDELLYNNKKLIIRSSMAGELNVLASLLYRLAQENRATRDFTYNRLRECLIEVVACFPVYRTYITSETINRNDFHFIEWAIAKAKNKERVDDSSAFDFLKDALLPGHENKAGCCLDDWLNFVLKFQQYTGPVMAKGMEDTSFYIYNRLLSLNEVGGEPKRFGISVAAFHHTNQDRLRYWPHSMLNSSTHDSKRSEDVRARINVLTEMVPEWKKRVFTWSKLNRPQKTQLEELLAPTRNDEYAFYQNLLGVWPTAPLDGPGSRTLVRRIQEATLKACREAKVHTSWMNPNQAYEDAVTRFVEGVLAVPDSPFMSDFLLLHQDLSWFGMLNSLSQVFVKLVVPGIPDMYQGCELWRFSLVDPDNRRPVNFQKRQEALSSLFERMKETKDRAGLQQELLACLHDGRAKMYVIAKTLQVRNAWQDVFARGSYTPLEVTGGKSRHICAFARKSGERIVIAIAPRLYRTLTQGKRELPLGTAVWGDTAINLPEEMFGRQFENIYSAESINKNGEINGASPLQISHLLSSWPIALLKGTTQ